LSQSLLPIIDDWHRHMEKPDLNEQPVAGTPSDSPLGCPILDFNELIKFRSDRSGSQAFSVLLYDMPECGAVDTETEENYGFAYRPRIEKGNTRITIPRFGLASLRKTRGNLLLLPPHVPVKAWWTNAGGTIAYFNFSPPYMKWIAEKLGLPPSVLQQFSPTSFSLNNRIDRLCSLMMEEAGRNCRLGPLYSESLGQAIAIEVLNQARLEDITKRRALAVHPGVERVILSLETRWHENVSVAQLAEEAHLSADHFAREFAKTTGLTPHQYLLRIRLSRARELIAQRNQTLSVAEIALDCGFYDQAHLARHFRRAFGETPTGFLSKRKYPKS
jgi:AraC family transcriptional regulator